jgi:hypothetical protein
MTMTCADENIWRQTQCGVPEYADRPRQGRTCHPYVKICRLLYGSALHLGHRSQPHTSFTMTLFGSKHISRKIGICSLKRIVRDKGFQIRSENKGLISTDRGTKTTLMRTIPRSILSRLQRICLFQYLQVLLSPTAPSLLGGGWTVQSYDLGPGGLELFFITVGKATHRHFQPGFWLRGVQP